MMASKLPKIVKLYKNFENMKVWLTVLIGLLISNLKILNNP